MLICLWGVLLESLMVATISEFLNFTDGQKNAYVIIQRLVFKIGMKRQAIQSIEMLEKIRIMVKNKKLSSKKEANLKERQMINLQQAERKFKKQMLTFKKKEEEMRKFDDASELTYLAKNIENLEETIIKMDEWQDDFNFEQEKIMINLTDYFQRHYTDAQRDRFNDIIRNKETKRWLAELEKRDAEELEAAGG